MTEKKVYDLTVDPEFRDLIPPLNEEELKLLEASIVADGGNAKKSCCQRLSGSWLPVHR